MEGLKIIEKSYTFLTKFREAIMSSSFSSATQLSIVLTNYDMQTQSGIKNAICPVLEVYKDDLDINVGKTLTGVNIKIKIPNDVDGFRDDLVDALKTYIDKRAPELWNIISHSTMSGGCYGI